MKRTHLFVGILCLIYILSWLAVPQDKKALWAVVIFMGNALAMPVYWYLYIWKPLRHEPLAPPS